MRGRRWWFVPLALPVLAMVGAVVSTVRSGDDPAAVPPGTSSAPTGSAGAPGAPVVVPSVDEPRYAELAALVAAADTVVVGEVAGVERGRVLAAGPGGEGIVTRLVRLSVDEVLAGEDPGAEVVVEEPGWLLDGTEVAVDGAAPSAPGDVGVWFLVRGGSEEFPHLAVINAQGRYLVDPADERRFLDVAVRDPLVDRLEALDPILLRHEIEQAARG
jgi:hypothetical protein